MRAYRFLDLITAALVTVLIVSNVASTKILALGEFNLGELGKWLFGQPLVPFAFDGGTILFPLAYIFGDVLTEVYGYKASRRVIWTGFACLALMALTFGVVVALPPDVNWILPGFNTAEASQNAFAAVLGQTPRIVLGSLVAYWAGEFTNSYILAKLKVRTQGKQLWARTISSTLVGQLVDTAVFLLVAFLGVFPNALLWTIFISNYIFKVGIEVVFTPITYQIVNFLKRAESEDYFDRNTDFNPLAFNN